MVVTTLNKWTGVTGQNLVYGLDTDGTYKYIGGSEYHGGRAWIAKVEIATNKTVFTWYGEEGQGNLVGLVYLNGAVYACLQSVGSYPSHVIKIATMTMTTVWIWDDPDEVGGTLGVSNANEAFVITDDTYIYFGRENGVSKIWKLTQDKVEAGLWTAPGGAAQRVFALTVHKASSTLYAVSDSKSWLSGKGLAYKINTVTMTTVLTYQPLDDDGYAEGVAVDDSGEYIYIGMYVSKPYASVPLRVSKIRTSDMTKITHWESKQVGSGIGIRFASGVILIPSYSLSEQYRLNMINPDKMSLIWTWDAPIGQTGLFNILPIEDKLYLSFYNYGNPPTVPAEVISFPLPVIRDFTAYEIWVEDSFKLMENSHIMSIVKTTNPDGFNIIYITY